MAGFGNIMNRSNPGERYLMGDLMGPDARFQDDIATIEGGVRQLVQSNPENPFLMEKVADYDHFRSNLGWYEYYIKPNETFDEAMRHYQGMIGIFNQFGDDSDSSVLSTVENALKGAGGFIINRSVSGTYYKGTPWGPDGRFIDDLKKIDDYVRTHSRPRIAQYPKSLKSIEDYEQWRQTFTIGSPATDFYPDETMNDAKAKLAAIRSAQGEGLSPTAIASSGSDVLSPPFVSSPADSTKPMAQFKTAGKIIAGVAGVILILLGVRAVKRGAGRVVVNTVKSAASSVTSTVQSAASSVASGAKTISTKLLPGKSP